LKRECIDKRSTPDGFCDDLGGGSCITAALIKVSVDGRAEGRAHGTVFNRVEQRAATAVHNGKRRRALLIAQMHLRRIAFATT
jgi:hypothetical protein